jgi:hypothetical protein
VLIRPAVFDRNVVTLDVAGLRQASFEIEQKSPTHFFERRDAEKPYDRHYQLLRPRDNRPRRRAA